MNFIKTFIITIISLILFISSSSFAQPGSLDTSFDPGTGADGVVLTTSLQSDGKIIIGGNFASYDGTARNRIARINADGSIDASFDPGTGSGLNINSTAIQSDGRIIIGGGFLIYNGTARNRIARLNTNGSLDTLFDIGAGASSGVETISIQVDGKIIIGGMFSSYNGNSRNSIARLNTDGSLDTSFDPGVGANSGVLATSIQSDGKIIIGGIFTTYNGTSRNRIARLNVDGSLDTTFNSGTGASNAIKATTIQSDGKIIISGNFTFYNGIARNHIARLNVDGSLDTSFDPGTGANDFVSSLSIQNDGKIIISGDFTSYNDTVRNHITRLNTDGSLDSSFDPGVGASSSVFNTSIQSDGKIVISGPFTSYNGTTRNRIARINSIVTSIDQLENEKKIAHVFPNPLSNIGILHSNVELKNATLTISNLSGQSLLQIENIYGNRIYINRDGLPAGLYFIQLLQDDQVIMRDKLIIAD